MEQKSGTVRAPLFSEQVALQAQLSEAWARELKQRLELAGNSAEQPVPKQAGPALLRAGAGMALVGLGTVVVAALLLAEQPFVSLAGAALSGIGVAVCLAGARAEKIESALLIRYLANAIGKRRKEGTNPGMPNPFHNK